MNLFNNIYMNLELYFQNIIQIFERLFNIDYEFFLNINYIVGFFVFLLIFIWIWVVLRVAKDITSRTNSFIYQIFCILLPFVFTPLFWVMIYILIRPISEKNENNFIYDFINANSICCTKCWTINLISYNCCIGCWNKIKDLCKECKQEIPNDVDYCPNCWAPNIKEIN